MTRLKRVNYFTGQLLSAQDFLAEPEYHREQRRRHNLHCHGFGLVQGLKVSAEKNKSGWRVTVEPGFALDAAGNEIQLCAPVNVRVPESRVADPGLYPLSGAFQRLRSGGNSASSLLVCKTHVGGQKPIRPWKSA